jgi:GNAT superfamily N-acetyltransferase
MGYSFDELEQNPDFKAVMAEYSDEAAMDELGPVNPQFDMYRAMENAGTAELIVAMLDGVLVGFAVVLVTVVPHYGKVIATMESLFSMQHVRRLGTGVMLMRASERFAHERGSAGLFVSARVGSSLETVASVMCYRKTNSVYFKAMT